MDDDQLTEQLLIRIACIFEDASAMLLLRQDTSLVDRVAFARSAADHASAVASAVVAIAASSEPAS